MLYHVTYYLSLFLLLFVCTGVVVRTAMLLLSVIWIYREKAMLRRQVNDFPRVSLLIPAFNEAATIVESITHVINHDYPALEIIVVNDGSGDETLTLLQNAFELAKKKGVNISESIPTQVVRGVYAGDAVPNLTVIDKKNGGKADALNCAINASTAEYILCLDADTVLTRNTIRYLVRPFLMDEKIVVTSGSVRIMSPPSGPSLLGDLQKIEFVNSISLFRTGWNFFNANMIVSGALGLFRKETMVEVGGYHNMAIGEDMEVIVRIHRRLREKKVKYRILQLALPTCFTSPVPNYGALISQRKRWRKGLLSSLRLHLKLLLNPRYRGIGLLGFPFYVLYEVLGPFMEILGLILYACLLFSSEQPLVPLLVWGAGLVFAVLNSWLSILLDKFMLRGMSWAQYFRLMACSVAAPFYYHFLQLYCKLKGTFEYFSPQISTIWDTKR